MAGGNPGQRRQPAGLTENVQNPRTRLFGYAGFLHPGGVAYNRFVLRKNDAGYVKYSLKIMKSFSGCHGERRLLRAESVNFALVLPEISAGWTKAALHSFNIAWILDFTQAQYTQTRLKKRKCKGVFMMKKILAVLLAGVMLCGFAACSSSGETSSTGSASSGNTAAGSTAPSNEALSGIVKTAAPPRLKR